MERIAQMIAEKKAKDDAESAARRVRDADKVAAFVKEVPQLLEKGEILPGVNGYRVQVDVPADIIYLGGVVPALESAYPEWRFSLQEPIAMFRGNGGRLVAFPHPFNPLNP